MNLSNTEQNIEHESGSTKFFSDMERLLKENNDLSKLVEDQNILIADLTEARDSIMKDAYRTLDLNFKLADSEEKLRNLNAQKDKFFSIIAHDLRNPLANFKQITSELSESLDNLTREEQIDFINDMANSAKQLFELLENLLEWSRSQTGRIQFNPVNIYLLQLVDNAISLLSLSAGNKNIQIISEVPGDLIIFADPNMISTVIRNLISNAIKFTPENGRINLYAKKIDPYVQLIVSDTGVGIAKENIDKLFRIDIFTSTRGTKQEKGTGLGLVLCKEFIEKHGGSISIESELGSGSKFKILLPKISKAYEIPAPYFSYNDTKVLNILTANDIFYLPQEEISPELLVLLPVILKELEEKYYLLYKEAVDTMMISSIDKFAESIKNFADNYKFKQLQDFGENLKSYAEDLELDKINNMLDKYPKIIKSLKEYIN